MLIVVFVYIKLGFHTKSLVLLVKRISLPHRILFIFYIR